MSRTNCYTLDNGDLLPSITFETVTGEQVSLPRDFKGHWGIFFLYRGGW